MLERCDCCGAYLEGSGLVCEECQKDMSTGLTTEIREMKIEQMNRR